MGFISSTLLPKAHPAKLAKDAPWGLTGDRHFGVTLPDGRVVIIFRNASAQSKDKGGFIAGVGTSIVSVRFKMSEMDAVAANASPKPTK